ncbi:MAG: EsaB/YukD family protein [Corynebacterium sp.]|nr:EsaB/YukD family protein [Corynebacterium sp.]
MTATFIRVSVFRNNRQLDVSLPADRPIIDIIDDITELFTPTDDSDETPDEHTMGTNVWALSSPRTGVLDEEFALSDYHIVDGQKLFLTPQTHAALSPFVDDVMMEVRHSISDHSWRWHNKIRTSGLLIISAVLALCIYCPAIPIILTSPNNIFEWNFTTRIFAEFMILITLFCIALSIRKPLPHTRWLAFSLPLTALILTYPLFAPFPAGIQVSALIIVGSLASIPTAYILGRGRPRNGSAGALSLGTLAGVVFLGLLCNLYGASMLALAAWSAWVPILILLVAPTIAINGSGLATLLRLNDAGETIDRSAIQQRSHRCSMLWFATALGCCIALTLVNSPYWQQGLCGGILALTLIFRSNGYSDARVITPLIGSGCLVCAVLAGSITTWIHQKPQANPAHSPWWASVDPASWQPWLAFSTTATALALILIALIGYQPHEVQEARSAKVISILDTVLSLSAIPIILIAQGVLTYYWAIT